MIRSTSSGGNPKRRIPKRRNANNANTSGLTVPEAKAKMAHASQPPATA